MATYQPLAGPFDALSILGMSGNPTKAVIKSVFRKLALEMHPDRGVTSHEEFAKINDAYREALDHAEKGTAPVCPSRQKVGRPVVKTSEKDFSDAALRACRRALDEAQNAGGRQFATKLVQRGSVLTFVVPGNATIGFNQIALPVEDAAGTSIPTAIVLECWSGDISDGVYDVPADICAKTFPDARGAKIQFGEVTRH